MRNDSIKKRIMFNIKDDPCFLAYNILIILDYFKCYSSKNSFNDYRKLPYLIDFTSSKSLMNILYKDVELGSKEKILLKDSYLNSSAIQNRVFLVLQSLKRNNTINFSLSTDKLQESKIFIQEENIKLDKLIFVDEYENIDLINKHTQINRLKTLKLSTISVTGPCISERSVVLKALGK